MAKRRVDIRLESYGIYRQWDASSKELPRIAEFTTRVPATVDIEFGLITRIKGAKNQRLRYCIDHPGILDADGKTRPPFDGTVFVRSNDWQFYLGDTIWEPVDDKVGTWKMTLEMEGRVVAEKAFDVYCGG